MNVAVVGTGMFVGTWVEVLCNTDCQLQKGQTHQVRVQDGDPSGSQHSQATGLAGHTELFSSPATKAFVLQSCLKLLRSCEPGPEQHAVTIGKARASCPAHFCLLVVAKQYASSGSIGSGRRPSARSAALQWLFNAAACDQADIGNVMCCCIILCSRLLTVATSAHHSAVLHM